MFSFAKTRSGWGWIILNGLRAMNIIALLAVIVASVVMLVKIVIDSQLFFFDAVSHVITACVSIFLITSELSMFRTYFARNWPLLSPSHGFVTLGLAMLVLGVNILGNLNKKATSQKSMGLGFWRIVIGSGVLVLILGFFNIIANYIFRNRKEGITARQVRAKGNNACAEERERQAACSKSYTFSSSASTRTASDKLGQTPKTNYTPRPRTPDNTDARDGRFPHMDRRPTLPSYHTSPVPSSKYSDRGEYKGIHEISAPMNINPQFAHLTPMARPDSAYHPSNRL